MSDIDTVRANEKRMSKQVYGLRRRVMDIIYELRKEIQLPRLRVRICDGHRCDSRLLGVGFENQIWITEDAFAMDAEGLFFVVAHEIGHAVFELAHDPNCPLMQPRVPSSIPSREQIIEVLRSA